MTNMNLYQIEAQYRFIAQTLIDNGGECIEAEETELEINKEQLENKARGFGFVILDIESEILTIESEIKRLSALKNSRVKTVEKLKERISEAMLLFDISEVKTATIKLSFRKSESIEVADVDLLDEEFIVIKATYSADKVKIKQAIKEGRSVTGAVLQINSNLQIK